MEPTKEEVKKWLKRFNHSRAWLGEQCGGASLRAVTGWLSSKRPIPPAALRMIERLMLEDELSDFKDRRDKRVEMMSSLISSSGFDDLREISKRIKLDEIEDKREIARLRARAERLKAEFDEIAANILIPQKDLSPNSDLSLRVPVSLFNKWEKAALARGLTLTDWAIETLKSGISDDLGEVL
jgi:hypothetical protein